MTTLLKDFDVLLEKLKSHAAKNHTILGEADRQINDIYHIIEYLPLSGLEKVKLVNLLRLRLRERREAKEVIADCDRIRERLNGLKESNREKRESKYKRESTEALNKIRQAEKW